MEEVFKIIRRLKELRGIPQFLFISDIRRRPALTVRKEILKFKTENPDVKEIDFILESPGGIADHAYAIIRTLRNNFEKVNIIVPFWAKSAATLLALGGSSIIMDEFGEFGPLDVQLTLDDELPESEPQSGLIDEYSLTTIENRAVTLYQRMLTRLLKKNPSQDIDIRIKKTILSEQILNFIPNLYKPLFDKVNPYQIGEKVRSIAIAERYAERILAQYNQENLIQNKETFIDYLVHECPDHGFNIDYSIMSLFLLNVKKSSEISKEYCDKLSELSLDFSVRLGTDRFVGFIDDGKQLDKKPKIHNTIIRKTKKADTKKSATKNEKPNP